MPSANSGFLSRASSVTRSTPRPKRPSRSSLRPKYRSKSSGGSRLSKDTTKSRSLASESNLSPAAEPKRSSRFTPYLSQSAATSALLSSTMPIMPPPYHECQRVSISAGQLYGGWRDARALERTPEEHLLIESLLRP